MDPRGGFSRAGSPRRLEVDALGVLGATSLTLIVLGAAQLIPAAAAMWLGGPWLALLLGALGTGAIGAVLVPLGHGQRQRAWRRRESLAVACLSWVMGTWAGAVPFMVTGAAGPIDAWFESVSGFTTTGATVFADVEGMRGEPLLVFEAWDPQVGELKLSGTWYAIAPGSGERFSAATQGLAPGTPLRPRRDPQGRVVELVLPGEPSPAAAALHLWRAICHWLGGAGIVLLVVVLVPWMGQEEALRRSQQAEASFLTERYRGSTRATLRGLLVVYVGATSLLVACLLVLGMSWWESCLHAMATISTGGFSPLTSSLGGYGKAIQLVVGAFMVLGALNFAVLGRAMDDFLGARRAGLQGLFRAFPAMGRAVWRSSETRGYLGLMLGTSTLVAALLVMQGDRTRYEGLAGAWTAWVDGWFNVTAVASTTGFCTVDFATWPAACQVLLLMMMLVGGCTGSTAGGLKLRRVQILFLYLRRELLRLPRPSALIPIKLGEVVVPEEQVREALGFAAIYLLLLILVALAVSATGTDPLSAGSSSAACLGCVGPGLGLCGPSGSYAPFAPGAKLVLILAMLLGRLEILAPLTVALPSFWLRRGVRSTT